MKNKAVFVLGPTSSGKTALSLQIAQKYDGEIVNIDSQQAIFGLDIATAKIPQAERKGIPHHLFDIYKFGEEQNVFDFSKRAEKVIEEIIARNNLPIIVGGTGLYARILSGEVEIPQTANNSDQRNELNLLSLEDLQQILDKKGDLNDLNESDRQNKRRLIRKIEKLGQVYGPLYKFLANYSILKLAKVPPKNIKDKIRANVNQMLDAGLLKETQNLLKQHPNFLNQVKAIGYKEAAAYLKGEIPDEDSLIELITTHTYQYAKRQITWLKKEPNITWVKTDEEALNLVAEFLV